MPESRALSNSLLSTAAGWTLCANILGVHPCLGINGEGKISTEDVAVALTSNVQSEVFIGTSKSCGIFAENSVIQDVHGKRWRAGEIVESGNVTDLKFEQVAKASCSASIDVETLWLAFGQSAAHQTESELILRCRSQTRMATHNFGRFFSPFAGRTYCKIEKRKLFENAAAIGSAAFGELIHTIFGQENIAAIPRESSNLVMFVVSHSAAESVCQLSYDAIQHTSLIYLSPAPQQDKPLGEGRVAQRVRVESKEVHLAWRNSAWNPLVNGLIVC